jgi:hypothetical protein
MTINENAFQYSQRVVTFLDHLNTERAQEQEYAFSLVLMFNHTLQGLLQPHSWSYFI